ncbi:flagellin [Nisaea acidiphila]|uniref:Flagellin n=1 Tax=Nisaea acidiphila TaxID=1862145 RepID=A0A9J7AT11_9PROT|nr:flagellin [Nisaea acidiphila]UUX49468.1 flagellin [Nisaea acidiphila]
MAINNSVNTNVGAFTALRNLNSAQSSQDRTQNRISTGQRVSGALDQAAIFAIAQSIRGELGANAAVQQGLNQTAGVVNVATAGATGVSNLTQDIQGKLVELSNPALTSEQQGIIQNDLTALLEQAQGFVDNASFNGTNLLQSGSGDLNTLQNLEGDSLTVSGQGSVGDALANLSAADFSDPAAVLSNEFAAFQTALNDSLGELGASSRRIVAQNDQLQGISDATEEGLGNLVDANLGREAARLASDQARSQLSQLSLGIANRSPEVVLGLFRS